MQYKERTYRNELLNNNLKSFNVTVRETDLFVSSDKKYADIVRNAVLKYRSFIESYIASHPEFLKTLSPFPDDPLAPGIVRDMIKSSKIADVGPMAAVAGAIAQFVGCELLKKTPNVIIENGGDIFLKTENDVQVGIFAGQSVLSGKVKIKIKKEEMPLGICTSSASVGHSISFGAADAVCIKSKSASLADAAATALGNKVKSEKDIEKVLNEGALMPGVLGIIIIMDDHLGAWGEMELTQ